MTKTIPRLVLPQTFLQGLLGLVRRPLGQIAPDDLALHSKCTNFQTWKRSASRVAKFRVGAVFVSYDASGDGGLVNISGYLHGSAQISDLNRH